MCTATSPRGITATRSSSGLVMSEQPHYRFPPASAYRLNRCLFALKSDDDFRTRFLKDARAAMSELGLDADDAAAVLPRRPRLAPRPRRAPYLVFMADLRLRMEREPVAFEFF